MYGEPTSRGYRPVNQLALEGEHTDASVWNRVYMVPSDAIRSRFGVTGGFSPV